MLILKIWTSSGTSHLKMETRIIISFRRRNRPHRLKVIFGIWKFFKVPLITKVLCSDKISPVPLSMQCFEHFGRVVVADSFDINTSFVALSVNCYVANSSIGTSLQNLFRDLIRNKYFQKNSKLFCNYHFFQKIFSRIYDKIWNILVFFETKELFPII